jgi:hypothetical protein
MINVLGTMICATIIAVGWLDSRGALRLFGDYASLSARLRRRPRRANRRVVTISLPRIFDHPL